MNGKLNTKRTYKIIACCCIWLAVIVACFGLACFKSSKVNAGIIIDTTTSIVAYNGTQTYDEYAEIGTKFSPSFSSSNWSSGYLLTIPSYKDNQNTTRRNMQVSLSSITYVAPQTILLSYSYYKDGTTQSTTHSIPFEYVNYNNETYILYDIKHFVDVFLADLDGGSINYPFNPYYGSSGFTHRSFVKTSLNTISSVDNIYDLQQGDVAIIYISDVSGFDSANYQPEIKINWGYIDSSDNTVYAAYNPAINVMKAPDDLEIWLNIPTTGNGTLYDSIILNQQALLTTITEGGATANANIYALYVWLLSDRIQWGLLNFNTAGLPASAASMNYFTSYTTKYDYINTNTGSMTCRLSISNNFNFITIKNQPIFSVNTINTTLRQGGLLPAWALYNWARGSAAGFTSGTQAGAAPYQPGNTGYNEIFQAGYNAGLTAQPAAAWYEAAFAAVDSFLDIHIFPSITFGELFGIPFVISVIWFIIRMFRGGGSNG